jgi:hypothetical protein
VGFIAPPPGKRDPWLLIIDWLRQARDCDKDAGRCVKSFERLESIPEIGILVWTIIQ